jgi:LPS sulfotransferase NodH
MDISSWLASEKLPQNKILFKEPKVRTLIMSSPRTGSTAMMGMLSTAGAGENPAEIFHQTICEKERIDGFNALAYAKKLAMRDSTEQGFFLSKVHFNQIVNLYGNFGPGAQALIGYFNKFIFIQRRDRIGQAISELFSTRSSKWNLPNTEGNTALNSVVYNNSDLQLMTGIIARQIAETNGWRNVIQEMNLDVCEVFYEDLIENPKSILDRVSRHIGLQPNSDLEAKLPTKKISEQDAVNTFRNAFLEDLLQQ